MALPAPATMSDLLAVGGLGLLAGLAVAVPLGPVGLLILDRSMRHGRATGLAAAGGVAAVDLAYAVVAVTAAAWVAGIVASIRTPATVVAAAIVAGLGVRGLVRTGRDVAGEAPRDARVPATRPTPATAVRRARTFGAFVALTAVNPATLLYFTALTVGLADRLVTGLQRVTFVAAVASSSLGWQAALALLSDLLGRVARPMWRRRTRQFGSVALVGLAAVLVTDALSCRPRPQRPPDGVAHRVPGWLSSNAAA